MNFIFLRIIIFSDTINGFKYFIKSKIFRDSPERSGGEYQFAVACEGKLGFFVIFLRTPYGRSPEF
jgi:hypothetical protein